MAEVIDALSFERPPEGRRYINYRDLGVQQLGSIYERLIEHEVVREGGEIAVRPNIFARKGSGSYYTPDDLVGLIVEETVEPLVQSRMAAFEDKVAELAATPLTEDRRIGRLKRLDPAEKLLELKICDPAMGSGHFLVNLVGSSRRPGDRGHGRSGSLGGGLHLAPDRGDQRHPQQDHGQRRETRLDHR